MTITAIPGGFPQAAECRAYGDYEERALGK
jgi:hypothetical protein